MQLQSLREFIHRETGIHLDASKEAMVASRLEKRIRALRLPSVEAYFAKLKSDDGSERIELIDVLTTNHTSFFREGHHFVFLRDWLLRAKQRNQRRFRIWCAASSTGEEPYSLAMTLREAGIDLTFDAKILCTDLSVTVLRKASSGLFTHDRMRGVPPDLQGRYFTVEQTEDGWSYRASPDLKALLSFNRLNLSQFPYPMKGPFDLIFCRNVFIYFQPDLIARILKEFHRLLPPGGFLLVGSSESLAQLNQNEFKLAGNSVYQRV